MATASPKRPGSGGEMVVVERVVDVLPRPMVEIEATIFSEHGASEDDTLPTKPP